MPNGSDHMSFTEWLGKLDACAKRAGYKTRSFVQVTGHQCWYADYAAGVSPEQAFRRAEKSAEEFGSDYLQERT